MMAHTSIYFANELCFRTPVMNEPVCGILQMLASQRTQHNADASFDETMRFVALKGDPSCEITQNSMALLGGVS